jgi:3-hydroxyacyl-[acyl-carrier-protein] dehydratase
MLLNNLCTVKKIELNVTGDILEASVRLVKEHAVFDGHFPGNPILPGVCTVQIARELLEQALERKLMLRKAGNIKYLGFISPVATPDVHFNILCNNGEPGMLTASVNVTAGGNTSCSFKAVYLFL